jgi:site-specific DNA recombinase
MTKTALLYARVSTKKQAEDDRYSIPQQFAALREYAAREGYEVLEEVEDPGYSGATLNRPGLDRVRDLVTGGGVSVLLRRTETASRGSLPCCGCSRRSSLSTAAPYAP